MHKCMPCVSLFLCIMGHPCTGSEVSLVDQIKMLPKPPLKTILKGPESDYLDSHSKHTVSFRKFVESVTIEKVKPIRHVESIKYHYKVRLAPIAKEDELKNSKLELQLQEYQDRLNKYPQLISDIYALSQVIKGSRKRIEALREELDLLDKNFSCDDGDIDDVFLGKWSVLVDEMSSLSDEILDLEYQKSVLRAQLEFPNRWVKRALHEFDVFYQQQQLLKEQIGKVPCGA